MPPTTFEELLQDKWYDNDDKETWRAEWNKPDYQTTEGEHLYIHAPALLTELYDHPNETARQETNLLEISRTLLQSAGPDIKRRMHPKAVGYWEELWACCSKEKNKVYFKYVRTALVSKVDCGPQYPGWLEQTVEWMSYSELVNDYPRALMLATDPKTCFHYKHTCFVPNVPNVPVVVDVDSREDAVTWAMGGSANDKWGNRFMRYWSPDVKLAPEVQIAAECRRLGAMQ